VLCYLRNIVNPETEIEKNQGSHPGIGIENLLLLGRKSGTLNWDPYLRT